MSGEGPVHRVELGDLSDLGDGEMRAHKADDVEVMVCRVEGRLHALEDLCSHADTTLSDGLLVGHVVTCPLHGAQFDVRDGTHLGPPAWTGVACFEISEDERGAVVDLPVKGTSDPGFGEPGGMFRTR
jgi:nitrite reductase/ring-hydroxylating ferredoxin subunit